MSVGYWFDDWSLSDAALLALNPTVGHPDAPAAADPDHHFHYASDGVEQSQQEQPAHAAARAAEGLDAGGTVEGGSRCAGLSPARAGSSPAALTPNRPLEAAPAAAAAAAAAGCHEQAGSPFGFDGGSNASPPRARFDVADAEEQAFDWVIETLLQQAVEDVAFHSQVGWLDAEPGEEEESWDGGGDNDADDDNTEAIAAAAGAASVDAASSSAGAAAAVEAASSSAGAAAAVDAASSSAGAAAAVDDSLPSGSHAPASGLQESEADEEGPPVAARVTVTVADADDRRSSAPQLRSPPAARAQAAPQRSMRPRARATGGASAPTSGSVAAATRTTAERGKSARKRPRSSDSRAPRTAAASAAAAPAHKTDQGGCMAHALANAGVYDSAAEAKGSLNALIPAIHAKRIQDSGDATVPRARIGVDDEQWCPELVGRAVWRRGYNFVKLHLADVSDLVVELRSGTVVIDGTLNKHYLSGKQWKDADPDDDTDPAEVRHKARWRHAVAIVEGEVREQLGQTVPLRDLHLTGPRGKPDPQRGYFREILKVYRITERAS